MRPNDPAGGDEAGGYARAIRAEPIGYRIDIDAVEIMEQEQRARQRGQPPDRGDPATIIQPAHYITCAATPARKSRNAPDNCCTTVLTQTPSSAANSLYVPRLPRFNTKIIRLVGGVSRTTPPQQV